METTIKKNDVLMHQGDSSSIDNEILNMLKRLTREELNMAVSYISFLETTREQQNRNEVPDVSRRIGIARDENLYAADYDIDEEDAEILDMFEVLK